VGLTVRAARPSDWATLRDVRLRALADAPDAFGEVLGAAERYTEADWRDRCNDRPDALRLLAFLDDRPIGMMVVVTAGGCANVYAMWVAPEARRRGAGRALVAAGLAWARQRAALDVTLHVSTTQPAARLLYERCGFVATGAREPLREGSPIQTDVMVQRLPVLVMGVVNVTPDSFSDGGEYLDPAIAIAHGRALAADGADILDVGGEATNPRASAVGVDEELRRVVPVIEALSAEGHVVSIDTTKAEVARACIGVGATIVNDVACGLFDPAMIETVRGLGVRYIAGHLRGRSLAEVFKAEGSVRWQTVAAELAERIEGLSVLNTWVDPGLGFGKGSDPEGNVALIRHAGDIAATVGCPIVVGASRKRFVRRFAGLTDGAPRDILDAASTLATLAAVRAGAHVVRVHNVALLITARTAYNKK
jgi:dihydropteroate synthase